MPISWIPISGVDALKSILANDRLILLFKHSPTCAISAMVKRRLERSPDERIAYYIIDVLENRKVSNALSEITGVKHESPQAYLFSGGDLIHVASHTAISSADLAAQIA